MSAVPDLNIGVIKRSIRERHLQQLSRLNLVADPFDHLPIRADLNDMVKWTLESKDQINAGINNKVYGGQSGSPINFNNAFMAFMESASMILRDTNKVVKAVASFRSDKSSRVGFDLLEDSTSEIDKIADMWGMYFIQICDFVELHPDGHSFIVGPFCGAFIPKDFSGSNPFIGLVFKGTTVTMEIINDLMAISTLRPPQRLWEAQVSKGFYYPLFTTYGGSTLNEPFVLIQNAVRDLIASATTNVITHVAGHSLGGAYATLTYSQLCIEGYGTPVAILGDLYTFGSPRTGRGDLAENVKAAVKPTASNSNGSTWRIVNDKDYVPAVPASLPWPFSTDPFIHVDSAYRIFGDQKPTSVPSEIGTHPTLTLPTSLTAHDPGEYYKSLKYATTAKQSETVITEWRYYPLAASPSSTPSAHVTSLALTSALSSNVSLQTVKSESDSLVVGTITFGYFFGEITAVGNIQATDSHTRIDFNNPESFKNLYSRDRQTAAVFTKVDQKTFDIVFIVGDVEVARARVSTADDLGEFNITRGRCVWSFRETPDFKLAAIEKEIANASASVFSLF